MKERTKQPKLLKGAFRELMKGVNTSVPGHIIAFDPATQLAQVQVGVARIDVNGAEFEISPIIETPVYVPGGDWCLEYQIMPKTEGLIVFSQRCIDSWVASGGVATNPIGRFHHMQDALFLPGFRSTPGAVIGYSNDGIKLRNKAGTQRVWLKGDGSISMENGAGHIRLAANGTVTINGVTFSTDGLVSTANDFKAGEITLKTHKTSEVTSGSGVSGVPIP